MLCVFNAPQRMALVDATAWLLRELGFRVVLDH